MLHGLFADVSRRYDQFMQDKTIGLVRPYTLGVGGPVIQEVEQEKDLGVLISKRSEAR